jgi:hypothetical protein
MIDRQKVTLRLNPELIDLVRQVAQEEKISPSSVIDRLLLEGLQRYAQDALDFDGFLQPTTQGRYAWTVEIDPNGLRKAIAQKLTIT